MFVKLSLEKPLLLDLESETAESLKVEIWDMEGIPLTSSASYTVVNKWRMEELCLTIIFKEV